MIGPKLRHELVTPKNIPTHLQESQPEVRAQRDFSAGFAVDAPPQRRAGRVAEELEESHEQSVLPLEDLNDQVLLQREVKRTKTDDGVDVSVAQSENAFNATRAATKKRHTTQHDYHTDSSSTSSFCRVLNRYQVRYKRLRFKVQGFAL